MKLIKRLKRLFFGSVHNDRQTYSKKFGRIKVSQSDGFAPPEGLKLSAAILETAILRSLDLPYLDIIGALHSPA